MSPLPMEKMQQLLTNPAYGEAISLCGKDIVLKGQIEEIRAQIAELKVFDPISSGYEKLYGSFERHKGELFVPVRRGWPQPNIVMNPDPQNSSVIQLNKVIVDGKESSFGSLLKKLFPDENLDGYDLYNAPEDAKIRLAQAHKEPELSVTEDTRNKALAIIQKMNV